MPKVIEDVQKTLLIKAKSILLAEGYDAFTIRRVAKECGIAVGTVYNYYPSKEMLAGVVMLEDWQHMLGEVSRKIEKAVDADKAFYVIYAGVTKFCKTYNLIWKGYSLTGADQHAFIARHAKLVEQIAACVRQIFIRYPPEASFAQADLFAAENILICSGASPVKFSSFMEIARSVFYTGHKNETI